MDSSIRSILLELLNFSTSHNQKLFVVGGTLRDYLSRTPCSDFDLTGKKAAELGKSFAQSLNFTCVPLDNTPHRQTMRIIINQDRHIDFTDLQGKNIEEDLSQRDFTINAMGQPLASFLADLKDIIDPYKGQEDLKNRKIRVLQGPIFQSDPLRILRAFRFAATLNFDIDEETLNKISHHKVIESAQERIWHELSLFFNAHNTTPLLGLLHNTGTLDNFFPITNKEYQKISTQYQRLEYLIQEPEKFFPEYADGWNINGFNDKAYLLKISVLLKEENQFADIESASAKVPPCTHNWNLRASNAETRFIEQTLIGARNLAKINAKQNHDLDEIYECINIHSEELLASVFLFFSGFKLNDTEATLFCDQILKFYFRQYLPTINKKPLLNGEDIIRQFGISPSPFFGKILYCVQKAHVLGNIATHDEALALAGELIQSPSTEPE